MTTLKGEKRWLLLDKEGVLLYRIYYSLEEAKEAVDKNFPTLIELIITKVYTLSKEVVEVE